MGDVAHNLPVALNSLVGRRRELAELQDLLHDSRMVTLTGFPGVGKTRLALEVAHQLAGGYPEGVWLVELAAIADPALVGESVARVLSVACQAGQDPTDALVAHIGDQRVLLVIDNCEHLVEPCARLAEVLLRGCPELSILATSQEALGFAGERPWCVPPLSLPDSEDLDLAEVPARSEAVQLFVERASAIHPGFVAGPDELGAVVEICRRLDGVALAIELAAARVGLLSPAEIAARLEQRFSLLTTGSRTVLPRHQSLLGAVEWSYKLLSGPEQVLLRRLSVFSGGATMAAATEVCSGGEVEPDAVCEFLGRLVARSLVWADTTGAESRYRLPETIRVYAAERLGEAGETATLRVRHCRWCTALAEQGEVGLTGADQQGWLGRLELEQGNVRAALHWAVADGQAEAALRLAGAFSLFWRMRGSFREGHHHLKTVLSLAEAAPAPLVAKALWGAGFMALMLSDHGEAIACLNSGLGLYTDGGDDQGRARCLLLLANICVFGGPADALALLEESVALARQAGDNWCEAHALAMAGMAHSLRGDIATARARVEEAVAVARHHGDDQGLRYGLVLLGSLAFGEGDYPSATAVLTEALALARRLGESYAVAVASRNLGDIAVVQGDYELARHHLEHALLLARRLAAQPGLLAVTLGSLGRLAQALGDLGEARRLQQEAVAVERYLSGSSHELPLQLLGEVCLAQGEAESASALFEEAAAHARAIDNKHILAAALHGLGEVARSAGQLDRAASLLHDALELRSRVGNRLGMVDGLESLAVLAGEAGKLDRAARLFGAAASLRDAIGYVRPPVHRDAYEASVATVRQGLGGHRWEAAWIEGSKLNGPEAVAFASRSRGVRQRPTSGWESLTKTEQAVVDLAAEGLTNAEIGARLLISPRTAERHLTNVFTKLGISGRVELAIEALRHRQDSPD